jgi:hypothetical protein
MTTVQKTRTNIDRTRDIIAFFTLMSVPFTIPFFIVYLTIISL